MRFPIVGWIQQPCGDCCKLGTYSREFASQNPTHAMDPSALIDSAADPAELSKICEDICAEEGFSHFAILERPTDSSAGFEKIDLLSNWPKSLVEAYDRSNLLDGSPVLAHFKRSTLPLVFDVESLNRGRPDGKAVSATEILQSNGINGGILLCASLANGISGGVLFCDEDVKPNQAQIVRLHYVASLLFERAYRLVGHSDLGTPLADIELQSLRYVAQGKSSAEISDLLKLSAFTVNRYLKNIVKKLGVGSLPEAVGKAIRLRLIS